MNQEERMGFRELKRTYQEDLLVRSRNRERALPMNIFDPNYFVMKVE